MTTYNGITKKFTIYPSEGAPVECYLKIGVVGVDDWERFPHLSVGDVCYLDLTVSKQDDSLRVYEVLMDMARKVIACGGTARDVADVLIGHQFQPSGPTGEKDILIARSVCDYIGRYLKQQEERKER